MVPPVANRVSMPSVAQRVEAYIAQDGVAQEAMRRGVINLRALARWIIAREEWDATEEAVLSALRRLELEGQPSALRRAEGLLQESHISMRSQICMLVLDKTPGNQRKLGDLLNVVDYAKGEVLRVIHTDRAIKVILDEVNLDPAYEVLGATSIVREVRGLSELDIVLPEQSLETPGILALISNTLGLRQLNIVELVSGLTTLLVVVDEQDALDAYEALAALVEAA